MSTGIQAGVNHRAVGGSKVGGIFVQKSENGDGEEPEAGTGVHPCRPHPCRRRSEPRSRTCEQAIREAIDAEISELADNLASTDDAHLFGDNEFKIRAIAHRIAAKAVERHLAGKKTATKAPR